MTRTLVRRRVAAWATIGAMSLALALGSASAAAQEASPPAGPPPPPEGCEVVADGLLNPRFIAIADDGSLYVTEAGIGGDEVLTLTPPGEEELVEEVIGTPAAELVEEAATPPAEEGPPEGEQGPPPTRGDTGQVTVVEPDGTQSVVADGLASYSFGSGPAGIALGEGVIWVAVGGAAVFAGIEPIETENSVVAIDVGTGEFEVLADLGSFEQANNPDGADPDSNLYGMDLGADGQLYVNDAGGNTVLRVDPATGEFALLGVVPGPALPEGQAPPADATPAPDEAAQAPQSVPTGLHVGADGNVYVGTLGAFIPGAGSILIAQADGTFVEAATGLTAVVGVALGPDGLLYASQFAVGGTEAEPGAGNVVRVAADGTLEPVVEGVAAPNGIAFDAEGNLYVVVNSVPMGPDPAGQVLRCEGVATAAGLQPGARAAAVAARIAGA